jgi:hypothetical protein
MTIGKRNLTKQPFDARIKVSIVQNIYMDYFKLLCTIRFEEGCDLCLF